jgi:hypothetical protein
MQPYQYPTEPYLILAGIIGYRTKDMKWRRQTRLRVTEFLAGIPLYSIRHTRDLSDEIIINILDRIHPQWSRTSYSPTPEDTVRQIRALCEKFNADIIKQIGQSSDYKTDKAIEDAVIGLYEVNEVIA